MKKRKVLVIFSNPLDLAPLRLGTENNVIEDSVLRTAARAVEVVSKHAATLDDLQRALLEHQPQVLHISGHGSSEGLFLEDDNGRKVCIDPAALAELIAAFKPEAVVLNACYSDTHADEFAVLPVRYLIAMNTRVLDPAAIEFARGFYRALGEGRDVEFAFGQGRALVKAKGFDETVTVLHKGPEPEPEPEETTVAKPPTKRFTAVLIVLIVLAGACFFSWRAWQREKTQVKLAQERLKAVQQANARPRMMFLDVVTGTDDHNKLRFTIDNQYANEIAIRNFRMVRPKALERSLEFGKLTANVQKIPAGARQAVDIEIERIVWRDPKQYETPDLLMKPLGSARIEVTGEAVPTSGPARIMRISSYMTLERIRAFVSHEGSPCDVTEEVCEP